ncbi:flagellin [Cupriavidus lacunae]|uniref:Flagellin n=1 Tax=Cupriavidus lacunae TaxID=2666307 RepID=A0A370NZE5_9BURK|nr:flagellin [Cupriavidus lacunae]RDK10898.1 flagellin [Cupriavidus lacunae]
MLQTSLPAPAVPRSAASAAAAMLLGAGLACAGTAQASMQPQPDALDASALPSQAAMPARDSAGSNSLAAARGSMAGWKPVAQEKLDDMRGGFEKSGLHVSFGIERAVYINGDLVVATRLNIPDVSRITADQAAHLASVLGPAIVASTNAAVSNALAGNPVTAGASATTGAGGASASAGNTGAAASAAGGAGAAGAGSGAAAVAANGGTSGSAGAPGASASAAGTAGAAAAAGLPTTVVSTATGQVVTNGLLNVIQNGPGNAASVGALAGTPVTVIQNTLNNQSIRSLMTIDASVNTLQAFRSQLANTALNNALLRAASMR